MALTVDRDPEIVLDNMLELLTNEEDSSEEKKTTKEPSPTKSQYNKFKWMTCHICKRTYTSPYNLRRHKRRMHTNKTKELPQKVILLPTEGKFLKSLIATTKASINNFDFSNKFCFFLPQR